MRTSCSPPSSRKRARTRPSTCCAAATGTRSSSCPRSRCTRSPTCGARSPACRRSRRPSVFTPRSRGRRRTTSSSPRSASRKSRSGAALRLQKYIAAAGIASRRRAEELIVAGRVRVGGRVVRELGTSVDDGARVEVDGRIVRPAETRTYVVLHKPAGVMTTMRDPEGRRTVADVVRRAGVTARVVPVGRLDYDTSGVLLLTDDGDTGNVLTHPRFGVGKQYRAPLG